MKKQQFNGISDAKTLGAFFFQSMKQHGSNIAQYISETGTTTTYGELLRRSIRVALKLRDKGINKNDIISTCWPNHDNSCVPLFATQFLGAISANFDPNLSHLDTIRLLDLTRPRVMFVSEERLSFMEDCLRKINLEVDIVVYGKNNKYEQFSNYLMPHHQEDNFEPDSSRNDRETAVIMFSSGTTGFPKGICLNHFSLLFTGRGRIVYIPEQYSEELSVVLYYTNLYWISSLGLLIRCMRGGYARVVCSQFDGATMWRLIDEYKVNFSFVPPHQAVAFLDERPDHADTSSLKILMMAGSNASQKMMTDLRRALPHSKIAVVYGQTETAGPITIFDVSNPEEVELQRKKPLSCGKMTLGNDWKVVDIHTEESLGSNKEGEFRIKCDTVMNGYFKLDSSSTYDKDGYLKTGDIVYYDEEGCFYIVDRLKEIFKYKGWHILPALLEEVLLTHPAVKEAVVVGIPHEIDGEHPMGIIVLSEGHDGVTAEDIELFFDKRVSDSQRLRAGVRIVKEIAKTITGKINRRALKQLVLDGKL